MSEILITWVAKWLSGRPESVRHTDRDPAFAGRVIATFTFHQGFVRPLQDVTLRQCLPFSSVYCFPVSPFTFHQGFVRPLQDVTLHQCLPFSSIYCFPVSTFTFHLSPRLCPSTAGCNFPPMPSFLFCLLFSCFNFHLSPFTKALSVHCRM